MSMAMKTVTRADVSCLNCGRFLGELEGELGTSYKEARFTVPDGGKGIQQNSNGLRCGYCGGKAIVERMESVRQAA